MSAPSAAQPPGRRRARLAAVVDQLVASWKCSIGFSDAWRVRVADRGAPRSVGEALLGAVQDLCMFSPGLRPGDLNPVGWTVPAGPQMRAQSSCPTMTGPLGQYQLCVDAGLLTPTRGYDDGDGNGLPGDGPRHDGPHDDGLSRNGLSGGLGRCRLTLPPPSWLAGCGETR